MNYKGTAHKVGEHIDTDAIIPARFLVTSDAKELGANCMAGLEPDWVKRVKPGDIMVAGRNFGCGSSREQAPIALKQAQVALVVAQGFARIFRRNCINIGMPVFVADAVKKLHTGEIIEVDLEKGTITAPCGVIESAPLSESVLKTLEYGGLIPRVRAELGITE